jgi:acetyl-CoA carboxylase biotin carboxylase subunit
MCRENGVEFIGPSPEAITQMGDKDSARRTVKKVGVPVIPGSGIINDIKETKKEAGKIGYPLLIKASAGGGGKGIRMVKTPEELAPSYNAAASEAQAAFGDGSVYLEKYLKPVKHVEMQILADKFGNIVCLGERDCSVQRNNQKLIEESPGATITEKIRKKMMDESVKAAETVNYVGAGTIEYLMDKDGNFYFIEMNTRLQVEHPVTEMITGIDIVKWQIRIAAGKPLAYKQEDITFNGHAMECRINAENPYQKFKPSCGKINMLHVPGGPWIRFDTAIYHGYSIPPFYDSMIGKLIVSAKTRDEAIRKMRAALCELIVEGVEHNADIQIKILSDEKFVSGMYTTDLLSEIEL